MITDEQLQDAKKKITSVKPKENYLRIKLGYDNILVLPYKDGIKFVESLSYAQRIEGDYGSRKRMIPLEKGMVEISPLSAEEFTRYQIATMLDISIDELPESF